MSGVPSVTAVLSALRRAWSLTLGRVLGWVLIGLIRFYQLVISPLTPPTCRFHPSCSAYALGSVRRHGPLKGFLLSSWRVLRCNPWNAGGLDPVPPVGAWRPEILPDGRPRTPAASHETLSADDSYRNPDCDHVHADVDHPTGVRHTDIHHGDVHHTTALGA